MGRLAARQGQIGAARRLFRVAAQLETGWGDPWLLQAILDLQNQDYPAALESLFEARARQLVETELSDLYYNTGEAYYYLSGADGSQSALASYSQALIAGQFSQASLAADAYYKRAVSYAKLGANAEISIPDLETAIAINPKHTWAHIMLGDLIFTARQDFARAEAELKTAISLSPGDKWPYRYLGSIYLRAGREEQALAMFHQVLALDPSDAPTAALVEQLSQP
jgi:tetratricopeptide (TPR) repeat protein